MSSDDSRDTVPKLGASARVTGEAGEKKCVRFAPIPRVIPDAWFHLLSEGVRFPSKESEEQLWNKLQGLTVEDIEPGRERPEAPTEKENRGETEHESQTRNETKSETRSETETETRKKNENETETKNAKHEGRRNRRDPLETGYMRKIAMEDYRREEEASGTS